MLIGRYASNIPPDKSASRRVADLGRRFRMMSRNNPRWVRHAFTASCSSSALRLPNPPWDSAPRYLLRDRDQIFGHDFVDQVKALGIKQVLSAPRSPWQRAYVERLIGSIRRECLDHVIVFGERSLHRTLTAYCAYYHSWRTHLSLGKDAPQSRRIQPPAEGAVVELREVGGLHHHYERRAA